MAFSTYSELLTENSLPTQSYSTHSELLAENSEEPIEKHDIDLNSSR